MKGYMSDFAFDTTRTSDFQLVLDAGDAYSEDGLTRVSLGGNGAVVVEHYAGKEKTRELRSEVGAEKAAEILSQGAKIPWKQTFPQRSGIPGEAILDWTMTDRQKGQLNVKTWIRDAEKDSVMASVLQRLREIVERTTHGELYL
jgi:hypothetical protein